MGVVWSWHGGVGGQADGVGWSQRWKRKEERSYHDITPLLCCYISERHSFSLMMEAVQGSWSGGGRGVWSIRVLKVEFLDHGWGMDLSMGSHMLSKFDQPTNLTRYHSFPHLNLEPKISSTSYSSWSLMVTGPGCRGCGCSAISSRM